jgi:cytochrome c-type biogenesis protein
MKTIIDNDRERLEEQLDTMIDGNNDIDDSMPPTKKSWIRRHQWLLVIVSGVLALAIASAWLVLPYLKQGSVILSDVGTQVQQERQLRTNSIGQFLTRPAYGAGDAEIDVLFATPKYFEAAVSVGGRSQSVSKFRPDQYLIFMVSETVHTGDLPETLPQATLIVDGIEYAPIDAEGPAITEHHRTSTIRFANTDAEGNLIINDSTQKLQVELANTWDDTGGTKTASWPVPIEYPEDIATSGIWSMAMLLALSAGLLSTVMTPCLLQLIIIYFTTLTGLTMEQIESARGELPEGTNKRLLKMAFAFVLGFILLYTAAGALIGGMGQSAQMFFSEWSRPMAIGSGLLIIAIGIWLGIRARAPIVCKIPMPRKVKAIDEGGFWRSVLVGAGFSLGCATCFSGALIATLLIYVGVLGSAVTGAAVLFMFALGIAVPFLLAALFLSRVVPLMTKVARYAPQIGLVSMIMMIGFGLVLITDNFHIVSNFIYPWLGLR